MELKIVDISEIIVGDRFREEYGDIDVLAQSLKKEGIIQPLAVCTTDDGYQLLAGGRRHQACLKAGLTDIPVRVYPSSISELEMRSIELMENICRKDLTWAESSKLKKEIHLLQEAIHGRKTSTKPGATGWSMRDTANLLGKAFSGVIDDIHLAEAMEVFPMLKENSTKQEAVKQLKRLQESMILEEIASRVKNKVAATPLERTYQNMQNSYIVEDFFTFIRRVPERSIDIVELDPPYGIGLDGTLIKENIGGYKTENYREVPVDEYVPFIRTVYEQCYRVMSDSSWIISWFALEPWFETVYTEMRRVGFKGTRVAGIWFKNTGQSLQPTDYLASTYEPFFYMRKGTPIISKQGRSNVFNFKGVSHKVHPTERPIEMIQEVLKTFGWEGARVLVPFLGSGNTLLAASNLNMTAFGTDLSEEYKNSYIMKVRSSQPGKYKSYKEDIAS